MGNATQPKANAPSIQKATSHKKEAEVRQAIDEFSINANSNSNNPDSSNIQTQLYHASSLGHQLGHFQSSQSSASPVQLKANFSAPIPPIQCQGYGYEDEEQMMSVWHEDLVGMSTPEGPVGVPVANSNQNRPGKPQQSKSPKKESAEDGGVLGWLSGTASDVGDWLGDAYDATAEFSEEYNLAERGLGALQVLGGVGEAALGATGIVAPEPVTTVAGSILFLHGADTAAAGLMQVITGETQRTITEQGLTMGAQAVGTDQNTAENIGMVGDMAIGFINPANAARSSVTSGVRATSTGARRAANTAGRASETGGVSSSSARANSTVPKNPNRLSSARRRARADAIDDLRESIESGIYSPQAQYLAERYGREALVEFVESGKLPDDVEFSHLYSAAEYPEFAHRSDLGVLTDSRDHRLGHHGGDTRIPLDGAPRDPDWESRLGTQEIDASRATGRRYLGMTDEEGVATSVDDELLREHPELFD